MVRAVAATTHCAYLSDLDLVICLDVPSTCVAAKASKYDEMKHTNHHCADGFRVHVGMRMEPSCLSSPYSE